VWYYRMSKGALEFSFGFWIIKNCYTYWSKTCYKIIYDLIFFMVKVNFRLDSSMTLFTRRLLRVQMSIYKLDISYIGKLVVCKWLCELHWNVPNREGYTCVLDIIGRTWWIGMCLLGLTSYRLLAWNLLNKK
jgi:hypothetical protein